MSEFEAMVLTADRDNHDALTGIQQGTQVRSTHREDGSLVSPTVALAGEGTLLEALGYTEKRLARVEWLKAAIASGSYFVSSGDVAERLMEWMVAD